MASTDLDGTSNTTDVIRALFGEFALISTPTVLAESPVEKCEVLESIEEDSRYQSLPISILCPGCNHVIKRQPDGLPQRLAHFSERCPHCDIELQEHDSFSDIAGFDGTHRQITTVYYRCEQCEYEIDKGELEQ